MPSPTKFIPDQHSTIIHNFKNKSLAELEKLNKEIKAKQERIQNVHFVNKLKLHRDRQAYRSEYDRIRNALQNDYIHPSLKHGVEARKKQLEDLFKIN